MSDKKELTQQERIDELLDVGVRGVPSGVFGREWCEACGKLGPAVPTLSRWTC